MPWSIADATDPRGGGGGGLAYLGRIAAAGLGDASEVRAAAEVGDASEVWAAAEDEEESFQGIPPMGDTLPSLSLPSIHARRGSRALPASHEGPNS